MPSDSVADVHAVLNSPRGSAARIGALLRLRREIMAIFKSFNRRREFKQLVDNGLIEALESIVVASDGERVTLQGLVKVIF